MEVEIMKKIISFTLDEGILEILKNEPNRSELVNALLEKHYGFSEERIEVMQKEIKQLQERLDETLGKKKEFVELKEKEQVRVVKENEYERELRKQADALMVSDRDLYNAICKKVRVIPVGVKKLEKRVELTNKALVDVVFAEALKKEAK